MTKCMRNFAFLMTIAMVVSLPAVAQQAGLTGAVTDPTGAVIPGAAVTVTHKGTGVARTTTTSADGGYLIQQLEPGQYRLEISMQGFKTAVRDPVTLPVGITSTVNATLEIGAVTEQVVVEEGVSGLNTVDASIGTPITGAQVLNLPSNSLDPAGLLSLQPGVTFVPGLADSPGGYSGIVDDDGRGGSVNGARSDQTNITLDGVDVNDSQNGYAFSSALRATQASLQEFRVTTSSYNSDLGRSSAAQVQLVTKSGGNSPHGMVYYTHRNDAFGANGFFNNRDSVAKGKDRRHIYGAALGGALVKDRLFLFGNFERMEEAIAGTVLNNVPTESFKDGVIIYECDDPALCPGGTVAGLTGSHSVPAGFFGLTPAQLTAIDPSAIGPNSGVISYLNQFPVANSTGSRDGVNIAGFRFNAPVENDYKTYIARLDFNIDRAGNHTFFARGTLQDDTIVSSQASFPGNSPNQAELVNSRGVAFGYKAILGATAISNLRYGYTRIGEKFSGVRNSEYVNLRFIAELNGFDGTASTRTRQMPSHHLREDFSVTKGSHTLSFGGEGRFTRNNRATNLGAFNTFVVNPSWLPNVGRNTRPGAIECFVVAACTAVPAVSGAFGSAWNDTAPNLLGLITQSTGNFNFLADGTVLSSGEPIPRRFAVNEFELYAQDSWRATPSLTLTFGLRYFNSTPPWETNGNQVAPQMVSRSTGQVIPGGLSEWFELRRNLMLNGGTAGDAPSLAFTLGGPANNAEHFYPRDNDNFSPRLAAAWNPRINNWFFGNGKMVIRGGYSLVYDRIGQGLAASFNANGSFGMSSVITSTFAGCDEGTGRANVPNGACARFISPTDTSGAQSFLPPAPPVSFPAVPPDLFDISQALNNNITTPYAHTFNLTISREVGNYTIDVGYVGRRGRDLLISKDLAMPLNLTDPGSGRDYFAASQSLIAAFAAGTLISDIAPDPFWENFFPGWGPAGANSGFLVCDLQGTGGSGGFSATQVAYDWVNCLQPDTTVVPFCADVAGCGGFPTTVNCSNGVDLDGDAFLDCPEGFFSAQFATLAAWSPDARSEYHSLQVSLRRRLVNGLNFTINYVFSHSLDTASEPERQGLFGPAASSGTGGYLVNSWSPDLDYASSSFDMRHQLNANWSAELPIGSGRAVGSGMPGWANHIVGGWALAGIFRANSGLPAEIFNGRVWATNWNVAGNAMCTGGAVPDFNHSVQNGPCAPTQNVKNAAGDRGPNLFADPVAALDFFRSSNPGERGLRNPLRADNYVNLDLSINKSFFLPWEGHILKFRWEMFNVTNSVFFDATQLNTSRQSTASFGNYTDVMGGPRQMQVSLRYEF